MNSCLIVLSVAVSPYPGSQNPVWFTFVAQAPAQSLAFNLYTSNMFNIIAL